MCFTVCPVSAVLHDPSNHLAQLFQREGRSDDIPHSGVPFQADTPCFIETVSELTVHSFRMQHSPMKKGAPEQRRLL